MPSLPQSSAAVDTDQTSRTPAIRVTGLSKYCRLGDHQERSLKSVVLRLLKRRQVDILKILDNLNLEVPRGQALGICGPNGAGKSTLLKIIAGIIPATDGTVEVHGRVASLLELGAGFHPDMTGAENVLLNGVILGIRESELKQKMAAIFRTAGLERFADTPIKHYSSGMVQRLGFSIASHLDPDILILDEVFAVGDALFQHSAMELFERFKGLNKTVLLVSHDLSILERYCDRVVMLTNGHILLDGPAKMVTHQYASLCWQHAYQLGREGTPYAVVNRTGDQRMRLSGVRLLNQEGNEQRAFRQFESLLVELSLLCDDRDLMWPFVSVKILDEWGQGICQSLSPAPESLDKAPPQFTLRLMIDQLLLSPGCYSLEIIVGTRGGIVLDTWNFAETFTIIPRQDHSSFVADRGVFFHHPSRWLSPEPS